MSVPCDDDVVVVAVAVDEVKDVCWMCLSVAEDVIDVWDDCDRGNEEDI